MDWQPIDSAPKDGTRFLAFRDGIMEVVWFKRDWFYEGDTGLGSDNWLYPKDHQPTHWMPLPEPPVRVNG